MSDDDRPRRRNRTRIEQRWLRPDDDLFGTFLIELGERLRDGEELTIETAPEVN